LDLTIREALPEKSVLALEAHIHLLLSRSEKLGEWIEGEAQPGGGLEVASIRRFHPVTDCRQVTIHQPLGF
jgi:hypothetical protein